MSNLGRPSEERSLQTTHINPSHSSDVGRDGQNPGELSRAVGLAERLEGLARKLIDAHARIHNLDRQLIDAQAANDKLERQLAEAKAENELQGRVLDDMERRIAALEVWEEVDAQERRTRNMVSQWLGEVRGEHSERGE